jgi:cytoskeletal protein CcmA (bactofilin family)
MLRKNEARGELNGFLDAGSHLQGELRFDSAFRVDGRLSGKVSSSGELVVGEKGEVEGEIHVGRLVVAGTVRGRVHAAQRVEIARTGRAHADLDTPALVIEEGGFLQGSCVMQRVERPLSKVVTAMPVKERGAAGS